MISEWLRALQVARQRSRLVSFAGSGALTIPYNCTPGLLESGITVTTPRWVLLPGLDGTGDLFDPLVRSRGPNSPVTVVRYTTPEMSRYVECNAVARASLGGATSYVLVGESFSGPIAISIAAEAPPGLCGLVLVGSFAVTPRVALKWFSAFTALMPTHDSPEWTTDFLLLGHWATPQMRTDVKKAMARVSPHAVRERLREIARVDVTAELGKVRVPILYLRATQDRLVPRSAAERIRRIAPHTKIRDIEGPHLLLQCAPDECSRAISDFVDDCEPKA
jgi:pimeloyl-ACP methyl ester carboxylesterase